MAHSVVERKADVWPRLTLEDWAPTQSTLHRWTQIVGKTRLALSPMQNHWWQVVLYVTERGLTTSPIPYDDGRAFDVSFDLTEHKLIVSTSDGDVRTLPLVAQSVADFFAAYKATLGSLGIEVKIFPVPMEMPDAMRFDEDRTHASYDPEAVHRCFLAVARADRVLKEFRGRFIGKASPSHFWWGGFDLACTRFSGRAAPAYPGQIPNLPDYVMQEAYSHECISAGWWSGNVGGPVAEPAFYAYSYPVPPGCDVARVRPGAAYYHPDLREWILPYEAVRSARDPDRELLEFLQSTYEAAAELAKWDRGALERPPGWRPPPSAAPSV